jgi:hypothetical protein
VIDYEPGLGAALHAARVMKRGPDASRGCTLCIVIRHTLGPAKTSLERAAAGTISARALQRALRESGVSVDRTVISTHRNEGHTPS